MGGTSRESLAPTRGGVPAQDGGQDAGIGDDDERHGAEQHHNGISKYDAQAKLGVSTGESTHYGGPHRRSFLCGCLCRRDSGMTYTQA